MNQNPRVKPIEHATKKTWDEWLKFLDSVNAKDLSHPEIAAKVFEELDGKLENPGWWAQSVTVAYEQHTGKRLPGQRADGTFEMSVSRATNLEMKELINAWADFAAKDKEVSGITSGGAKVTGTEKRMHWRTKGASGTAIAVTSEPKVGGQTASIIVTQSGLETPELMLEAKEQWAAIINRFVANL